MYTSVGKGCLDQLSSGETTFTINNDRYSAALIVSPWIGFNPFAHLTGIERELNKSTPSEIWKCKWGSLVLPELPVSPMISPF